MELWATLPVSPIVSFLELDFDVVSNILMNGY